MPTRRSRLVVTALLALLAAAPACNKKESSEREAEQSAQDKEPPRKIEESAAAATKAESATADDTVDGYRVIKARTKEGETASISVKAPKGWDIVAAPTEPDPEAGNFTLDEATEGLPKQGTLAVQIKTTLGSFYCDLFSDKTPNTVANFVGLARGKRKFWDADTRMWALRPYYDGTTFHRVIPGFMIQGGDHTGTGKGGIGYTFADEVQPTLHHDRPGQLCMANRGPNTNEAQFFVTEGATPHLDGSYTIFGQCEPATLVQRISRVPQSGMPSNRPLTPVVIEKVEVRRVAGGAAKWMPDSAKLAPMPGVPAPGRAVQVQSPGGPVVPGQ